MTLNPAFRDSPGVTETSVTGVLCPRCHRRSVNEVCCDHCRSELPPVTTEMMTITDLPLGAVWSLASFDVRWPTDPGVSFDVVLGDARSRVRGIRPELWRELEKDVRGRQAVTLSILPPIRCLELGGGALVLADAWEPAINSHGTASSAALDELLSQTREWCRRLESVISQLHGAGYVWLDFDPTAIEVQGDQMRITNLDWRLFPFGRCPSHLAQVSPSYSPPEVCQLRDEWIGPKTDVFHLALAVYYRLAGLGVHGFSGKGLESFRFEIPSLRVFRPDLPPGIWPILRRALAINPMYRQDSVRELVQQLDQVFEREIGQHPAIKEVVLPTGSSPSLFELALRLVKRESRSEQPADMPRSLEIDVGSLTIPGKAKSALGAPNQDCAVVLRERINGREVLVMIVADGVTHALVGTGDRASNLGVKTLVGTIRDLVGACPTGSVPSWPVVLDRACQFASQAIVGEALAIPDRPPEIRDCDMMSTTALIGVLDGHDLYLANVGDSRAYLLKNSVAEQLTIDGDVASFQLQVGVPPEQVQELGSFSKALRYCLGACRENDDGTISAEIDRAKPAVGHWRVEPGDVFVLCSDGLVEERVFLEPDDLVRIVESRPGLSAQVLAERLVAAADARQRAPSALEPNGYGDNISCIVFRVKEGRMPGEAELKRSWQ